MLAKVLNCHWPPGHDNFSLLWDIYNSSQCLWGRGGEQKSEVEGVRGGRGRGVGRGKERGVEMHSGSTASKKIVGGGYFYSEICSFSFVFLFYLDQIMWIFVYPR